MTRRRALVVHTRMPAFDRDSGSQDIDNAVKFLLDAGWSVAFLAREEAGVAEERHAARLRQMGVATYTGFGSAERVIRSDDFDLALIAFWEHAARILPMLREQSPRTRVVVNSMDVHFLRHARRSFGQLRDLDAAFARDTVQELNAYRGADAVITVSDKERALLADFVGEDRVFTVPLGEHVERSTVPLSERRGMVFVANFRHLPNREAAEYVCGEVLPLLDRDLLAQHPLSVIGNWFDEANLAIDPAMPGLELIGWVPKVKPYVDRARLSVVSLLHGAGVKRKVLQSMMGYTPVVTTPVGAEGLDLVQGEHALIATDAADLAAGITRLVGDDELWQRLAASGAAHVMARHDTEVVRECFDAIIERVMSRPVRAHSTERGEGRRFTGVDDNSQRGEIIAARIRTIAEPDEVVLVASGGDPSLVDLGSQPCWHFPQGRDGAWAGYDPVDGPAAITHLEAQRTRGARYFVLPAARFSWRLRFPELQEHLEHRYRRVHQDESLIVYDLATGDDPVVLDARPSARLIVLGRYSATRTGPPTALVAELSSGGGLQVEQRWTTDERPWLEVPDASDADYVVFVRDDAILPSRFLVDLIATQETLGAARLQPAHTSGPAFGPPVTGRARGTVAREIDAVTALPVLSVRTGSAAEGPVVLADNVTVGLREPLASSAEPGDAALVRRVWIVGADGTPECYERPEPQTPPRIAVLIATYNRTDLLRECLTAFAKQTLDRSEYEVVVIDDGSAESTIAPMLDEFADELQLVAVRIAHAGRSAAKNLAVFLSRSPIVCFFDDDDRPSADYLERHLHAHEAKPDEAVAILGHTDWAPELDLTPLMHFVTDVDRLMFAYERLVDGQQLDWRGFWEGRISCKRSFLLRHALHDQRINYSIDVEMAWRLAPHGLRVIYDASALSVMARPLDLDGFCDRTQAKGKAHAVIAALHPGTDIARAFQLDEAVTYWEQNAATENELRRNVIALEARSETDESVASELYASYRKLFRLLHAKGVAETTGVVVGGDAARPPVRATSPRDGDDAFDLPPTVQPFANTDPDLVSDGTPSDAPAEPRLSISIPVWSVTPELADMARGTIERLWEVARVPTEVVVVDNGSPHQVPLAARVYRYPENKGVATGWNTGIRLSRAGVVAVLNSDCRVEPGWDEALYEAATDGRRVAFPYTDHCDGLGFVSPDQGGTAGWCFMMARRIYDEVGVFDEWFNPAFCEDTDYWHRAWRMGIELSPVPAARVIHARRTTASTKSNVEWLLQGHRYKYGWKHGVDPHRAPPYYNREITDYHGSFETPQRSGPRDAHR